MACTRTRCGRRFPSQLTKVRSVLLPHCLCLHQFARASQITECSHCQKQQWKTRASHFSKDNMDPGEVTFYSGVANDRFPNVCGNLLNWNRCLIACIFHWWWYIQSEEGREKDWNISLISHKMCPDWRVFCHNSSRIFIWRVNVDDATTFYDFRVRREKIEVALRWLKHHNRYYRDVVISEEGLSQLPDDENLGHLFVRPLVDMDILDQDEPVNQAPNVTDDMGNTSTWTWPLIVEHIENHTTDVCVGVPLITFCKYTEDKEIERLLQEYIAEEERAGIALLDPKLVQWRTRDAANSVNAYWTEGYIVMAFPALFPYGSTDLWDQSHREYEVGTAEYFNTPLQYKDGRFGCHQYAVHCLCLLSVTDLLINGDEGDGIKGPQINKQSNKRVIHQREIMRTPPCHF